MISHFRANHWYYQTSLNEYHRLFVFVVDTLSTVYFYQSEKSVGCRLYFYLKLALKNEDLEVNTVFEQFTCQFTLLFPYLRRGQAVKRPALRPYQFGLMRIPRKSE